MAVSEARHFAAADAKVRRGPSPRSWPTSDRAAWQVEAGPGLPSSFMAHVGQHELHALELADRLAELLGLFHVPHGVVQRALGDAEGLGGDRDPRVVQGGQRGLNPVPSSPMILIAGIGAGTHGSILAVKYFDVK